MLWLLGIFSEMFWSSMIMLPNFCQSGQLQFSWLLPSSVDNVFSDVDDILFSGFLEVLFLREHLNDPSYFQVLSNYRLRGSMWRFPLDCRWPWFYRWILQHNVWKVSMTPTYIFHFMTKSSIFTAIKPTWISMDLELLLLRLTKAHPVSIN